MRARFLFESLQDLKARLRSLGSDLLLRSGIPEDLLPELLPEGSVLVTQEEVTAEEKAVDQRLRDRLEAMKVDMQYCWGSTLLHLEDLPFEKDLSNLPDVFTLFKNAVAPELKCACNAIPQAYCDLPKPTTSLSIRSCLPDLKPGSLPPSELFLEDSKKQLAWKDMNIPSQSWGADVPTSLFEGGEKAGLHRLEHYCLGPLATYAETKNNMLEFDASTKLSPWLANGCLSPRRIFEALRRQELQAASASTYWLLFALLVRDFFRFMAMKYGNRIFKATGVIGKSLDWSGGDEEFAMWCTGSTGYPLVDANMRELKQTGWMSNRGRQNVASFLIWDLKVDWRRGARWFETRLIDYDVTSNWCNWISAAGLSGGRINRFNVVKQSHQYDPSGDYLRKWLPELRSLTEEIHEPWKLRQALHSYPAPCVDPSNFAAAKPAKSQQKGVSAALHGPCTCLLMAVAVYSQRCYEALAQARKLKSTILTQSDLLPSSNATDLVDSELLRRSASHQGSS